jgi:PEP-CTERM motif
MLSIRTIHHLPLVFAACAICARASILIDFAGLSQAGSSATFEGNSYTQQGFTFTDQLDSIFGHGLAVWQASSPNLPGSSVANTSLFEYYAESTTVLKQAGNVPFALESIDLAQYWVVSSAGSLFATFVGTRPDLSTVTQTFTLNYPAGTPQLQTFHFSSGFDDVIKVSFEQSIAPGTNKAFQFDNLVIASTVPEPSSFLILLAGLAMLAVPVLAKRITLRVS